MPTRDTITYDGVEYPPGKKFRVLAEGVKLVGWVPADGGSQGWQQELRVGDVIECTGFGRGTGSDPGYGVEWTSDASREAGAFHVEIRPDEGGMWNYRPAQGVVEPVEGAAKP